MSPKPLLLPAALAVPLALLTACSGNESGAGPEPIAVTASDTECTVAHNTADAGTITFDVHNTGSKVTEFYLYAEGDRIMGEVENVTPGLQRRLIVEVADGGEYTTACKPGQVGDGIRNPFTVTGNANPATDDNARLAEATASYQRYVVSQADALLERTTEFVNAVRAGDVATAKALFPQARTYWERIEPVAESFGDLDPKIDGREDVVAEGMAFTGYHRLERDLWQTGLQPDSTKVADQLLADVTEIVNRAKTVTLTPLQLANGAKELLDEVATGKVTGEEDRYSHTDLWDFQANVEGSEAAIAPLRPVLMERNPELVTTLDQRFAAVNDQLAAQRSGDGFKFYTELTPQQVQQLSMSVDALGEPLSKVAGVVAGQ
ncbi:MAG: iron uptake system protein EfeO [Pseudonocardiaceae bacterium]